jgi:predicted dehydrogenase
MQVGVVGCGHWGKKHLQVLRSLKKKGIVKKIIAVDSNPETLAQINEVDATHSFLPENSCDLVILATPSVDHANHSIRLLEQGNHLLVEKPLACSEEEAAQVLACAQKHGRILSVGLLLRFHPAIIHAHTQLKRGSLGQLLEFNFTRRKTNIARAGADVMEEIGVHGIDLACHLLGECDPRTIISSGDSVDARMTLEYAHGIEAHIDVAWESEEETNRIEIIGDKAIAIIDSNNHASYKIIDNTGESEIELKQPIAPLEAEIRDLLAAVSAHKNGNIWRTNPDHGAALRCVKLTQRAIYRPALTWPD